MAPREAKDVLVQKVISNIYPTGIRPTLNICCYDWDIKSRWILNKSCSYASVDVSLLALLSIKPDAKGRMDDLPSSEVLLRFVATVH